MPKEPACGGLTLELTARDDAIRTKFEIDVIYMYRSDTQIQGYDITFDT